MPAEAPVPPERPPEHIPSPERFRIPELPTETPPEASEPTQKKEVLPARIVLPKVKAVPPPTSTPVDPIVQDIEAILEDGLNDAYQQMDEMTQQEFKVQGETTAREVAGLLRSAKVGMQKIVKLIVDWLKLLPGVSQLFVEQEAKIKADKLLALKRRKEQEDQ